MKRLILAMVLGVLCATAQPFPLGAASTPPGPARVLSVPGEFPTIQAAVDAAEPGDKIVVGPGEYAGAVIRKAVELTGSGPDSRITSGSAVFPNAAFYVELDQAGADAAGVTIGHFAVEGSMALDGMFAGVVSRAADYANGKKFYNVEVSHNTFRGGYYGVYFLNCERSTIAHNEMIEVETPVMLWAAAGATTSNNVISYNTITSAVSLNNISTWRNDGIWLNAIAGGVVADNQVVHNRIARTGGTVAAPAHAVFFRAVGGGNVVGNYVAFNDVRGSDNGIGALPAPLLDRNDIVGNLGENRAKPR